MVGAALKSLRNTDFNMQMAICEVVDNSLQANAKEIKIKIEGERSSGQRLPRPQLIAFGDDGEGMDPETLQFCLKLGYSGRYDDRKGIGRFGVGMTFAAISLCQKIEVYSRQKHGNWHYTNLDITNSDKDNEPEITPIKQIDLPEEYKNLVGDFGTLVIWSKIDRIDEPIKEENLKHNLGRIYRKFIGQQIIKEEKAIENPNQSSIYINNQIIHSHDPLFVTKSSQFPDDETADIDSEVTFDWNVHPVDAPTSGEKTGKITIRASLLPESWRQIRARIGRPGSGRSKDNLRRKIDANEGISILRHGREVAYGPIPHLLSKDREIDRFWSCEIDFEPSLDHWFSVRNIKIGARPLDELKEELRDRISPSIERFRDEIKKTMDEYDRKENETKEGPIEGRGEKEDELNPLAIPPKSTDLSRDEQKDKSKTIADDIFDDPKTQEDYIKKVNNPENKYNIIEVSNMRQDSPFFEIVPDLATKVMHYNMNHEFFLHLYRAIEELKKSIQEDEGSENLPSQIEVLKGYFDNLFFAYSEAYYDLGDRERQNTVGDTLDEFMSKWNFHLRKIYKKL